MVRPPELPTDEAKRTLGRQRPDTQTILVLRLPVQMVAQGPKVHCFPLGAAEIVDDSRGRSSTKRFTASPAP